MLNGKSILITGGTGSFGRAFVSYILKKYNPKKIVVFSRDEMKQWEMSQTFNNFSNVRFFIGDIRDKTRLDRALKGIDFVVHAAAMKIVETAEYNPFECVKTNILGSMNVIDACIDNGIKKVVALSTDKASSPVNLYGSTKLVGDKLFVHGNSYVGNLDVKFSVVRYGNVMGSRGSIIPYFLSLSKEDPFPVTDKRMTRFMITLEQGIDLVLYALENMDGGEIYVKKIPSMNVMEIANSIDPDRDIKIIGIRPGEKLHEQMIGEEDARYTFEFNDHYKILPQNSEVLFSYLNNKKFKKVDEGFVYASDKNTDVFSVKQLRKWINKNRSSL